MELALTVNGRPVTVAVEPGDSLLHVLRERLFLTGTKEGCDEGECGACTVMVDGRPIDSCIFPAMAAADSEVVTVEGLTDSKGLLSALQQSFIDNFAVQCGFCTPGFVVTLTALLSENPEPSSDEIRRAVVGNLCRCTGYEAIVDAVMAATGRGGSS